MIARHMRTLTSDTAVLLRLNRLIRSNRLKFLYVLLADLMGVRHTIVRFDPTTACNLRCGMCYFSDAEWYAKNLGPRFTEAQMRRIADTFFAEALQVHIGCAYKPTMFKGYLEIVRLAKEKGVPFVGLVTNAQLLTEASIDALIERGLDEITVSVHGVTADTYHALMRNASFERLNRNLEILTRRRRESGGTKPALRINYTVNSDNLAELADFFRVFGDHDLRCLQIRPITKAGGIVYDGKTLVGREAEYRAVVEGLRRECAARGVVLLANTEDPTYAAANAGAVVYKNAVVRYVGPHRVWKVGFDLDADDYRAFKRRIGYRATLLRWVVLGSRTLEQRNALASSSVFG